MAIVLGDNQYGKAETRVVAVGRGRRAARASSTSTSRRRLRGDFAAAHPDGDHAHVLTTDTQKNTVFAFARTAASARRRSSACGWPGTSSTARPVDHRRRVASRSTAGSAPPSAGGRTTTRSSAAAARSRTAVVTAYDGGEEHVLAGLTGPGVLKTTGSEFCGLPARPATRRWPQTHDRILATALTARWRWAAAPTSDCDAGVRAGPGAAGRAFGSAHSLALQQTLWEMGQGVLAARADIAEVRMSAPNKHHFLVDLSPFGLDNPGEVFVAADRPYGLIEVAVGRDEDRPCPEAWRDVPGFV